MCHLAAIVDGGIAVWLQCWSAGPGWLRTLFFIEYEARGSMNRLAAILNGDVPVVYNRGWRAQGVRRTLFFIEQEAPEANVSFGCNACRWNGRSAAILDGGPRVAPHPIFYRVCGRG